MKIVLVILLACVCNAIYAQTGKISGEVLGSNKKAIEGAVVSLLKSKDSSFVKASISEADGKFEFVNLKEETYLLFASR